jgi:hypothetical protein
MLREVTWQSGISGQGERSVEGQGAAQAQPNILVIWGDDIGQSNLSCYTHG